MNRIGLAPWIDQIVCGATTILTTVPTASFSRSLPWRVLISRVFGKFTGQLVRTGNALIETPESDQPLGNARSRPDSQTAVYLKIRSTKRLTVLRRRLELLRQTPKMLSSPRSGAKPHNSHKPKRKLAENSLQVNCPRFRRIDIEELGFWGPVDRNLKAVNPSQHQVASC